MFIKRILYGNRILYFKVIYKFHLGIQVYLSFTVIKLTLT